MPTIPTIPPPLPPRITLPKPPRIICYHQTHYRNQTEYVSILPLIANPTGITHLILAAIHLNSTPGDITLNDHPPTDPIFTPLWTEVTTLQVSGIKILFMLGGAAKGTFTRLDTDNTSVFESYYLPLRDALRAHNADGVDLDVEEEMSLRGIIRLIDRLKADFGDGFIITLAPVASAMQRGNHLSGFDYEALEIARGGKIDWYNVQFYCGWGSMGDTFGYEMIMACGWPPNKVVAGVVTNGANGSGWVPMEIFQMVVVALIEMFPGFGGVMGWEYFNGLPGDVEKPWEWAMGVQTAVVLGLAVTEGAS